MTKTKNNINNINKILSCLSLIISVVMLGACSSTDSPEDKTLYYQLPNSAFYFPNSQNLNLNEISVQINLAEHLKTNSLLYQTDELHVNFAQKNVWAMPLADSLAANLANKLNDLNQNNPNNQNITFVPQKLTQDSSKINQNNQNLKIYFDRFQGTYLGEVHLSGYFEIINLNSKKNIKKQSFNIKIPQQGDGYDAMVRALDLGLTEIAKQIY